MDIPRQPTVHHIVITELKEHVILNEWGENIEEIFVYNPSVKQTNSTIKDDSKIVPKNDSPGSQSDNESETSAKSQKYDSELPKLDRDHYSSFLTFPPNPFLR